MSADYSWMCWKVFLFVCELRAAGREAVMCDYVEKHLFCTIVVLWEPVTINPELVSIHNHGVSDPTGKIAWPCDRS